MRPQVSIPFVYATTLEIWLSIKRPSNEFLLLEQVYNLQSLNFILEIYHTNFSTEYNKQANIGNGHF